MRVELQPCHLPSLWSPQGLALGFALRQRLAGTQDDEFPLNLCRQSQHGGDDAAVHRAVSTICCLAICTINPLAMQCSSISRTRSVDRTIRFTSANTTTSPAWAVSVSKRPMVQSRHAAQVGEVVTVGRCCILSPLFLCSSATSSCRASLRPASGIRRYCPVSQ